MEFRIGERVRVKDQQEVTGTVHCFGSGNRIVIIDDEPESDDDALLEFHSDDLEHLE